MDRTPPDAPDAERLRALGAFAFLYFRSPRHRDVPVSLARRAIQPPVDLGFYRIFDDGQGVPRAGVTWAMLSEEASARFAATGVLEPRDWASGPELWFVEIVAPLARGDGARVMRWLRDGTPLRFRWARYLRFDAGIGRHRVVDCRRLPNGRVGARAQRFLERAQTAG